MWTWATGGLFKGGGAEIRPGGGYRVGDPERYGVNKVASRPVNTPDADLVAQAARGDRDAQRALFDRHREMAFRVALRVTRREADALDVVQDAFIQAFSRLGEFQLKAGFRTWLLRIVTNRGLDLLRARRVRLAVPIDGGGEDEPAFSAVAAVDDPPAAAMERTELAWRLQRAIDTLPAEQRAVFALYATAELTYAEIAEVLEIPIGTVMSRLHHARRKLGELLPDLAPPDEKIAGGP